MIEIKKAFGLLAIAAALAGCTKPEPKPDPTPEDVKVTSVSLNPATLNLVEGENATLSATVLPENATDKSISWSSSDATVATVADGVVQAIAPGLADITVKTSDGGKTASCKVTVEAKVYPVESVSLDKTTATLTEGQSLTLTATVLPENASNKNLLWSSSDPSVATVADGVVEAVAPGETDITVTTEDGGKTASCKVTVEAIVYPVTGVSLSKNSLSLTEGDTEILTVTITPANATNKNFTWYTSNKNVATIEPDGTVRAEAPGEATISVKTEDGGKTAECKVTVVAKVYPVTGVSLDKTELTLTEGDNTTLTVTITPANATNKNFTWYTSNKNVATIEPDGTVTAVAPGEATISVKTEDGSKTAECRVSVVAKVYPVTGVSLDKTSLTLTEGDNATLTETIAPANATNKNVTWSSSKPAVATVDQSGKVTAVAPGEATITVTTSDGGKTAECKVTVVAKVYPVTGVSLDKTSLTLTEGDNSTLTETITPANATNKNVTWSSSKPAVATVDQSGKVTAVAPGEATITVTTSDGGKTATCKVTVVAKVYPVTGVSLDKTSLTLTEGDNATLTETITPTNATNKNVTWSSSKPAVATVDQSGKVTAVAPGEATITVTTADGGKTATCAVTVKAKIISVTGVTLDKSKLELGVGTTGTLTPTVNPSNATNKNVTWSSSKPAVASVSNGTVSGLTVGEAVITVTTEDGSFKASCTVTVTDSASGGLEDPQPGGEIPWD